MTSHGDFSLDLSGFISSIKAGLAMAVTGKIKSRTFYENHEKWMPGLVPEALGEVLGQFWSPGVTQNVPGTPGVEKVMKSSSLLRLFPNF